jgi:chromosome partitioning protein
MAITITMGIQKGGCGKSTTTGVLAHLLSQECKVLVIDMDSQGNLTELLTRQPSNDFVGRSVLESMQLNTIENIVVNVSDNLDILPANNFLATFPRWIYTGKTYMGDHIPYNGKNPSLVLDRLLERVRDSYDFILIDTAPSLSEQTTNALCASEFVVVMYECSDWGYSALPNFMDSVEAANEIGNRDTKVIGILRTINDARRYDAKAFVELVVEDYPGLVFDTIITRKATTGRLPLHGFENNKELKDALGQYNEFYKELIDRVQNDRSS